MWVWSQRDGVLSRDGQVVSRGYSGHGRGLNNPGLQGVPGVGPIPVGLWRIAAKYDSEKVGAYALVIHAVDATPDDDTHDATHRAAFRIHGDNVRANYSASEGCIILPRVVREKIWTSGDRALTVQVGDA